MTFEELMGRSLAHAETAENLLSRSTQAMLASDPAIGVFLSMAGTHAMLAESYARLASAQIVNGTSVNQMMANLAAQTPMGGSST